ALIAGGHTFGKAHGAAPSPQHVGPEPEGAPMEQQLLGWKNNFGTGAGDDTITSGLEGAWTDNPTKWDQGFFDNLVGREWEQVTGPGGAAQWTPKDGRATTPDAHDPSKKQRPMMLTTDLSLVQDPIYAPITKRFQEHPEEFADAFAKAWFKLTHRDMGPRSRYLGALVPAEPQLFQDPVPAVDHPLIGAQDAADLKARILASGLSIPQLVSTAWASATTFRGTDKRGGANGARIRLAPQKDWAINKSADVASVVSRLEQIQAEFNGSQSGGKKVSLADMIVLGGCAAVEQAAKNAGLDVQVPFSPGRTDAVQEQTDVESFAVLEPTADGFRNYLPGSGHSGYEKPTDHLLVDRAEMLTLTAPEMTVLVGGMRALNANVGQSENGVFTKRPGTLTNDFFVNLLDMGTEWHPTSTSIYASSNPGRLEDAFEGRDRRTGEVKWKATRADLVFGSNSQLRALAEVYGSDDGQQKFARDFVAAWHKVMNLDRFDLA
ncbi:MAG TPA: peroxidase family protein, partial [Chloroflexota bacterium]